MIIKELTGQNFRNLSEFSFEPSSGTNLFFGKNAAGKTNILEAVSLCFGFGFRRAAPRVIRSLQALSSERTEVNAKVSFDAFGDKQTDVTYSINPEKQLASVSVDGIPRKSAAEIYGEMKYVVFVPEHLAIVKGAPDIRRDYIDRVASLHTKAHAKQIIYHKNALRQVPYAEYNKDLLDSYLEVLTRAGLNLTYGRLKYFNRLKSHAVRIFGELTNYRETLNMEYVSSVFGQIDDLDMTDKDALYAQYINKISLLGTGGRVEYGVHRDDITFTINGGDTKLYASQGQIRSVTIALKLAETELIKELGGERPVVLLDEVLGELDENRREFLTSRLEGVQVFVTSCNEHEFGGGNLKVFKVEGGTVEPYEI
ncbi:MAG: DNA replication and repair protein RecF [Oscillospiraceae bacterium]|nr:DNA replication and repair protein RecF [Oscillospiraceae bacterium]